MTIPMTSRLQCRRVEHKVGDVLRLLADIHATIDSIVVDVLKFTQRLYFVEVVLAVADDGVSTPEKKIF